MIYTREMAREIIMTGTQMAMQEYRLMHGIHSPMELKKFSKKQLNEFLKEELEYINSVLQNVLPPEVLDAMN